MKHILPGRVAALFLLLQVVFSFPTLGQQPTKQQAGDKVTPSSFDPLERWNAAVASGDRGAIASFYSTSPAASAKTPQGETTDPSEEPAFWALLRSRTAGTYDLKVLETKTLQPGVMGTVLRLETKMRTDAGEKPGVVSVSLVWGQLNGAWKIFRTQRSDLVATGPLRMPQPARPNPQLYPDPSEGPLEVAQALEAAAKDHKRVIVIFGGNWCYDCHVLDATFRSKVIAPLVQANYHVVHVNIGEYDKNLDLAQKYNVPLNKGVPSLAVLDPDGTLVFSQRNGEFENTGRIGPEDVEQFLEKWKPQR
jgi:thioredoxin 1